MNNVFQQLPLGSLDTEEVKKVVAEAGDQIFHMGSKMGSNHQMPGVEDPLDHGKRPFHQGTGSGDSSVSSFILF